MPKMTIDQAYEVYKNEYAKLSKTVNETYDTPLTKLNFKMAMDAQKTYDKMYGKHFQGYDRVAKSFARDSVYEFSYAQARAWSKASKLAGLEGRSVNQFRELGITSELEEAIRSRGIELKGEGLNSYAISKAIGQEFFGSL